MYCHLDGRANGSVTGRDIGVVAAFLGLSSALYLGLLRSLILFLSQDGFQAPHLTTQNQ